MLPSCLLRLMGLVIRKSGVVAGGRIGVAVAKIRNRPVSQAATLEPLPDNQATRTPVKDPFKGNQVSKAIKVSPVITRASPATTTGRDRSGR